MTDQQIVVYSAAEKGAKVIMRYLEPTEEDIVEIIETEVVPIVREQYDQERADLEAEQEERMEKEQQRREIERQADDIRDEVATDDALVSVYVEDIDGYEMEFTASSDDLLGLDCEHTADPEYDIDDFTDKDLVNSFLAEQFLHRYSFIIPKKYAFILDENSVLPEDQEFLEYVDRNRYVLTKIIGRKRFSALHETLAPRWKRRRICPCCDADFIE